MIVDLLEYWERELNFCASFWISNDFEALPYYLMVIMILVDFFLHLSCRCSYIASFKLSILHERCCFVDFLREFGQAVC